MVCYNGQNNNRDIEKKSLTQKICLVVISENRVSGKVPRSNFCPRFNNLIFFLNHKTSAIPEEEALHTYIINMGRL